ncbi:anti-sigma factor [Paeniglutamicibacter psychrophenolicus]|uniref:Regulator of SigK n=1 Tax=Paeniglutamicibacter psychrophenolicus TaxID=257454 RepID=A0ABS4WKN6_9MICC|nr:anti-sigma factor [Paeniglutamicibacter psychrophenolicus]MBP2376134.1 anti-sigma-K factor RskA [Paeniglutamicibacter psychrophenolicus]
MDKQKNELTGSFALNALNDAEREELLRDAEASQDVRQEVEAMQETAALLGLSAAPVAPPARVKANIMSAIRNTPQLPPAAAPHQAQDAAAEAATDHAPESATETGPDPLPRISPPAPARGSRRMFALAAGVLLVAAGALGGVVANQNAQQQKLEDQLAALNTKQAELTRILSAADVRSKTQELDNGARVTLAYSATEGMMAVTTAGLPALPSDKGYELWLISGTGAVSAGMVDGAKADGMVMVSGSMQGVTHFGITVEPASGSPAPTSDPILVQAL